jgi:hypothetical protein
MHKEDLMYYNYTTYYAKDHILQLKTVLLSIFPVHNINHTSRMAKNLNSKCFLS